MAMFPVLFAIGGMPGWLAQWQEGSKDPEQKIARPRQIYVGEILRHLDGEDDSPHTARPGWTRTPCSGRANLPFGVSRRGLAVLPGLLSARFSRLSSPRVVLDRVCRLDRCPGRRVRGCPHQLGPIFGGRQPRLGRAVGISVASVLPVAVVYPLLMIVTECAGPDDMVFLLAEPVLRDFYPDGLGRMARIAFHGARELTAMFIWFVLISAAAYLLLLVTVKSFDRLSGRMPERSIWSPGSFEFERGSHDYADTARSSASCVLKATASALRRRPRRE